MSWTDQDYSQYAVCWTWCPLYYTLSQECEKANCSAYILSQSESRHYWIIVSLRFVGLMSCFSTFFHLIVIVQETFTVLSLFGWKLCLILACTEMWIIVTSNLSSLVPVSWTLTYMQGQSGMRKPGTREIVSCWEYQSSHLQCHQYLTGLFKENTKTHTHTQKPNKQKDV